MKLIQIGNAKSGNFWLYRILQQILLEGGVEIKSFIKNQPVYDVAKEWKLSFSDQAAVDNLMITPSQYYYRISSILQMPIEKLDDYLAQTTHVWLQSPPCELTAGALSKFEKIIYIVRDPRDVAISNSKYAFTPYRSALFPPNAQNPNLYLDKKLEHEIYLWVTHVGGYLKLRSQFPIHVVFYERFIHSFDEELSHLIDYLGLNLSDSSRKKIQNSVSFESMKAKDPQHVRSGKIYSWGALLTKKQKRGVLNIAKPMLKFLNYPLHLDEKNEKFPLPSLADNLSRETLETAIRYSKRKFQISKIQTKILKVLRRGSLPPLFSGRSPG